MTARPHDLSPGAAYLTVAQVAELLAISRSAAYEMVATDQIPSLRLGRAVRVPRAELLDQLDRLTRRPTGGTA